MAENYPEYFSLVQQRMAKLGKELPNTMRTFNQMHQAAVADGALSMKTKELIALAIAITVRCDGCISFHVHDAMKTGATRREIAEAVAVAVMMGGGPSVVYGSAAIEAIDQFEAAASDCPEGDHS